MPVQCSYFYNITFIRVTVKYPKNIELLYNFSSLDSTGTRNNHRTNDQIIGKIAHIGICVAIVTVPCVLQQM